MSLHQGPGVSWARSASQPVSPWAGRAFADPWLSCEEPCRAWVRKGSLAQGHWGRLEGEGKGELTPGHVGYKLRVRGGTPRRGGTTATKLERHTLTEVNSEKSEERVLTLSWGGGGMGGWWLADASESHGRGPVLSPPAHQSFSWELSPQRLSFTAPSPLLLCPQPPAFFPVLTPHRTLPVTLSILSGKNLNLV